MTVNVGVIGVGMIGQDHIRRLTKVLAGAAVVAVSDVELSRAQGVAEGIGTTRAFATGEELIADPKVEAVLVTSWGPTHEQYVLACIACASWTLRSSLAGVWSRSASCAATTRPTAP